MHESYMMQFERDLSSLSSARKLKMGTKHIYKRKMVLTMNKHEKDIDVMKCKGCGRQSP